GAPPRSRKASASAPACLAATPAAATPARERAEPRAAAKAVPDITAITGRWDELVSRVRLSGKALLAAALESSAPHAITRAGDLAITLDEDNDFHAKAIEQARGDLLAILAEWFTGITSVGLHRESAPTATGGGKQVRMTDEMARSQRLNNLRRKHPTLDGAVEVLDLELAD
ncbi:MAG: hypothetical protein WD801_06410, partial [Gemmatimonadaceae bacterium]